MRMKSNLRKYSNISKLIVHVSINCVHQVEHGVLKETSGRAVALTMKG